MLQASAKLQVFQHRRLHRNERSTTDGVVWLANSVPLLLLHGRIEARVSPALRQLKAAELDAGLLEAAARVWETATTLEPHLSVPCRRTETSPRRDAGWQQRRLAGRRVADL